MPPKKDPPSVEESLAGLADGLAKLLASNESITRQIATQIKTTTNLVTTLAKAKSEIPLSEPPENDPPPPYKSPRIQLPFFDGSNPLDWLFQADQYFTFYAIPTNQRLALVAFYLQGDALSLAHPYSKTFKPLSSNLNNLGDSGAHVRPTD